MSNPYPKFKAKVLKRDFKAVLEPVDASNFDLYLKTMPEYVSVAITPYKELKGRSNEQNRYLWGCVYPLISESTGHTALELHDIFKSMFLSKPVKIGKVAMIIPKSSTDLSTVEMEEFLRNIREFSSMELGIFIPLPNEAVYE